MESKQIKIVENVICLGWFLQEKHGCTFSVEKCVISNCDRYNFGEITSAPSGALVE
jgi:hypothetical protein